MQRTWKKKKKSLAKTEHGKGFYLCCFVHLDSSDTMKYQKLHATRLSGVWGGDAAGNVDAKKAFNVWNDLFTKTSSTFWNENYMTYILK